MQRKDVPKLILFIIIIVAFIVFSKRSGDSLNKNGKYTKGVITRFSAGAKGARYVNYAYSVDGMYYSSFTNDHFCDDCKTPCCSIGDSVIVHFDKTNPGSCELVHQLPE